MYHGRAALNAQTTFFYIDVFLATLLSNGHGFQKPVVCNLGLFDLSQKLHSITNDPSNHLMKAWYRDWLGGWLVQIK